MAAPRYDASTALIVVDVQNDFADPSGSLYVSGGETIVAPIAAEMAAAREAGATLVVTQDWHPAVTPHFSTQGGTWPVHCVRDTWGAELHPSLPADADLVVRKGTTGADGYSAFTVADPVTRASSATGLAGYLDERSITGVVVVGLASDVCVAATAKDAAEAGFTTTVLWELTKPVFPDAVADVLEDLAHADVTVITNDVVRGDV